MGDGTCNIQRYTNSRHAEFSACMNVLKHKLVVQPQLDFFYYYSNVTKIINEP